MLNPAKAKARLRLDERLHGLKPIDRFLPPPKGWLRALRDSLGMSGTQFAKRLGVAWQSMDDLEKSEANGTIQLATLRRAASALDCTLVYALVPNSSLQEAVSKRSSQLAIASLKRAHATMALEDQQVDASIQEQIDEYVRDHVRDRDLWQDR